MDKMRVRTIVVLLFAMLLARPVWAQQQTGVISGTVTDSQGGAVPGATVEAKGASGNALTATTDASGTYRFPSVQPGVYEVENGITVRVDALVRYLETLQERAGH